MMKKRLLIVSHALELGGAERSLVGLLSALDPERVDVDLFLLRHEGELMSAIPSHVNLLSEMPAYTVLARPMAQTLKEGHLLLTAARVVGKTAATLYDKLHGYTDSGVGIEYSHKYTYRFMPKIQPDVEYDAAISFLTPHYIVWKNVRAKKKIAWIHTDYTRVQINVPSETKMWGAFDHIASISDAVTATFSEVFGGLRDKLVNIENILPADLIRCQTTEGDTADMPKKGVRLLSVGRYCTAKNFDNVPAICSRLLKMGHDVYWYIIGFGPDEELIKQNIIEAGMEDRVILLGKKENPYPYIAACDVYVQPSRYEGKCVTVREAQLLAKPVVIARYATASSQLEENIDGVIVPQDNEGCADGIAALLADSERLEMLSQNCRQRDYSNAKETQKLYGLL